MADEFETTRREEMTDAEIAAAVGEELPDRDAMSTSGSDPGEFGSLGAAIPPGGETAAQALPAEEL
jgi:hypothetical protein